MPKNLTKIHNATKATTKPPKVPMQQKKQTNKMLQLNNKQPQFDKRHDETTKTHNETKFRTKQKATT